MLTRLTTRNFKRFDEVTVELGSPVIFIGPNNSGKTTALQALAVWDVGVKKWTEKRRGKSPARQRPGATLNRRDIISVPLPGANLLWRNLRVREANRTDSKPATTNVRIDLVVDGISNGDAWSCGMELDYANEESFYVRPLRLDNDGKQRMEVPEDVHSVRISYLPPMSGLASSETRLDRGAINVRLGEGRTAEVLRNLCLIVYEGDGGSPAGDHWEKIHASIQRLFGIKLDAPKYIEERGEIVMTYRDENGIRLDLSSSGRGLQQTLLLLAHMTVNPGSVLLLDEPDAHLEILRQRQIYQTISDFAVDQNNQIIAASHSEVILNEAADKDVVIAFVGRPHRIDDRGSQLLKSLKEIGFEQYYQAEQTGWVLYLEGSTDLSILRAFAEILDHPAKIALERPFVHYVDNLPNRARLHFHGIAEAKADLVGIALFDSDVTIETGEGSLLTEFKWSKRETENYLCSRDVLLAWAKEAATKLSGGPLFSAGWESIMEDQISETEKAMRQLGKGSPWDDDTKVSTEFLEPLFENFFAKLGLENLMRKSDFHQLARFVPAEKIDAEVVEVLDCIHATIERAKPTT